MMHSSVVMFLALSAQAALPVRGVVEGPDGKPVEGALVYMTPYLYTIEAPVQATTNARGEFTVAEPADKPLWAANDNRQLVAYKPGVGIAFLFVDDTLSARTSRLRLTPTVPIRVRVVDPAGKPVADAEFRLSSFSSPEVVATGTFPSPHFRSRTDAQGEVTLGVIPEKASFGAKVHTEAFGTQLFGFRGDDREYERRLRPVGQVRGRVLVADAPDLSGVPIAVMSSPANAGAGADEANGWAEVVTDADGRFDVPVLAEGQVRIQRAWKATSRYMVPQDVQTTVAAGEAKEVVVPAEWAVRLHGSVVVNGEREEPLAGVRLSVDSIAPGRATVKVAAVTAKDGTYELFVPRGTVVKLVRAVPAPFLMPDHDVRRYSLNGGTADFEFEPIRVKRGVPLAGVVVDEQNRPVRHARVKAAWENRETTGNAVRASYYNQAAETDEKGEFAIPAVSESAEISLTAADDTRGSTATIKIDAERPESRTGIRVMIELVGLISISGRVIDATGNPVEGVQVQFLAMSPRPDGWPSESGSAVRFPGLRKVVTDADGRFETLHPITRLADYSVVLTWRRKRATVRVPAADRTADRVKIPDIVLFVDN